MLKSVIFWHILLYTFESRSKIFIFSDSTMLATNGPNALSTFFI